MEKGTDACLIITGVCSIDMCNFWEVFNVSFEWRVRRDKNFKLYGKHSNKIYIDCIGKQINLDFEDKCLVLCCLIKGFPWEGPLSSFLKNFGDRDVWNRIFNYVITRNWVNTAWKVEDISCFWKSASFKNKNNENNFLRINFSFGTFFSIMESWAFDHFMEPYRLFLFESPFFSF